MTEQDYKKRHEYCVYPWEVKRTLQELEASGRTLKNPEKFKPHCDHPEDGYCGPQITQDKLLEINNGEQPRPRRGRRPKNIGEPIAMAAKAEDITVESVMAQLAAIA